VTEERVSNFGDLLWEWTRGPSSGHDGDIVKRRWRRPGIHHRPASHAPHLLSACLASRSKTRVAVGYRGQQAPVRTPGRCTIEIGAMVLTTDAQGHPEW